MPVHRCTSRDLDEKVADIEQSERIVAVTAVGNDTYVIFTAAATRTPPKGRETR